MGERPERNQFGEALRSGNLWGYYREATVALRARLRRQLPSTRFVIFAQGRTGSRLLCELLDSHSQIECGLEILRDPLRDVYRYVRHRALVSRAPAYGFKVKASHIERSQGISGAGSFLRRMHEDGWRIVYLMRRNLFRQVYSGFARQARGAAHSRRLTDGSLPPRPVVKLDVDEVIRRLRSRKKALARDQAALEGLPFKTLVYEDDLLQPAGQQRAIGELVAWLELKPEPVKTDLVPNTPRDLREVIANASEVEAGLRGTEFEDLFREATGG